MTKKELRTEEESEAMIARVVDAMPDVMAAHEVEALLCSMVEAIVGVEKVPEYFEYMAYKSEMVLQSVIEDEKATRH
jgi:hypothetical protein